MRYVVVGTSGSGKTTLARELAQALNVPHVELDALHWLEDWTPKPTPAFVASAAEATRGTHWVVDGNYSVTRPTVWPRATHIVWLNFDRSVVFPRVIWRTLKRALLRERLWQGNRESIRKSFFSRDSILLWSFNTFAKNRAKFAALRDDPTFSRLTWIELTSPHAARQFLAEARRQ